MNGNIEEYVYICSGWNMGMQPKLGFWQHFATMLHTYVRSNRNKFIQLTLGSHRTHVLVLTGNGQVPQIAKEHRDGNTIEKTQQNDLNVRRPFREIQYTCVSLFVNWRHHDRAKKHAASYVSHVRLQLHIPQHGTPKHHNCSVCCLHTSLHG